MRQLDPGATILCREADFDQLLLPGRQLDDPGKSKAMERVIRQHGSPRGFAPVGRALEHTSADPRLDRTAQGVGAGVDP
jgi:hypothetical protein